MKAKDIKVGTRVLCNYHILKGTVVSNQYNNDDRSVIVEWDDSKLTVESADKLHLFDEFAEDFDRIRGMIKQAAAIMKTANSVASKHGKIFRFSTNMDELLEEIEYAGWKTEPFKF
jgi:hypothetical protein